MYLTKFRHNIISHVLLYKYQSGDRKKHIIKTAPFRYFAIYSYFEKKIDTIFVLDFSKVLGALIAADVATSSKFVFQFLAQEFSHCDRFTAPPLKLLGFNN